MATATEAPKKGMLVLTRRQNETIQIMLEDGRIIEVTVAQIRGGNVRIGISADRNISIRRGEIGWKKSSLEAARKGVR